jgi:tetratricopeptide (TPR) repeat protein
VLAGRCLAYGEGTTYSALADLVRGLGGNPRRRVEELLAGDEQAIGAILGATGLGGEPGHDEETAWALRRLLERLARDRPLVVAVEDIHWAEPALLDLLDHVVALSSSSPILLLCLTRPELLETRPAWAAPQHNRALLVLDALGDDESSELARRLGANGSAARIARRAEGNPLFVEQLVEVAAGDDEEVELPASIQAVLAARIDRLDPSERTLLQHAAVEGRTFHAGALAAALPEEDRRSLSAGLVALARKGLVSAARADHPGEDGFRFTHALIREAAYAGLPKHLRARLHATVARWLDERPAAADEIVGFHLEQACLLAAEVGQSGALERGLAARAAARLDAAAGAALGRGDPPAAIVLLERAITVVASDEGARTALLPALGRARFEAGEIADATRALDEAIERAREDRLRARAQVEREFIRLESESGAGVERSRAVADAALPVLERAGDEQGQSRAWSLRAQVAWIAGRIAEADHAWNAAGDCAGRAGNERDLFDVVRWRATAAMVGPTPVPAAIERCEQFLALVSASPVAVAWTRNALAVLRAMNGEHDVAAELVEAANETLDQLGTLSSKVSHHEALVRMLAGRPDLAEVPLRAGMQRLQPLADGGLLATTAALLAQAVCAQGRVAEADELCAAAAASAAAAAADDIFTQVIRRGVRARVLAHAGRCDEAVRLAGEAIALVEPTDMLAHHGDALLDLAAVLRACGRAREARDATTAALALYDAKGSVAQAARARALLD